jgi:hypothetical protein
VTIDLWLVPRDIRAPGRRGDPKPNTVYLSLKDERFVFDAWRVSVMGMFDLVDGHLAFDDSGVGSVGAGGEKFVEDLDGDALAGVGESVRGKNPGGWRWFAERPGGSG